MQSIQGLCRPALSDRTNAVDTSFKRCRSEEHDHKSAEKRPRVHAVDLDPVPVAPFPKYPSIKHPNCSVYRSLRIAGLGDRHNKYPVSSRPILASFVSSNKSDLYSLHSKDDATMPGLPFACAFTGEAKRAGIPILAIGTQDGTVELLNVSKRRDWEPESQRTSLHIHDNAILDLKWSKDDRYLATASGDSTVRITSATNHKTVSTLSAHASSVKTLDWHPHHIDILSSGGRDGHIHVWDLRCSSRNNSDNMLAPVVQIRHAHDDVSRRGIAKSNTSKTVTSLIYRPDAPQHLVSAGSFDGKLRKWDLRYPLRGKPVMVSHTKSDPTMAMGVRGRGVSSLALGSSYTEGSIWGITADSCIYKYTEALDAEKPLQMALKHSNLLVKSFYVKIATSPCGKWLASGSSGGGVYIWDVATRSYGPRIAVELQASRQEIGAVDWSSDMLAACCDDGTVRIWRPDLETILSCRADPVEKKWEWTWASSYVEE